MRGDTKKILILWGIVVVSYGLIIFVAQPARLWRLPADQQASIAAELQQVWCDHAEIDSLEERTRIGEQVDGIRDENRLTLIDARRLLMKAVRRGEGVDPCLYTAVTRSTCVELHDAGLTDRSIWAAFGLRPGDVEQIIDYGRAQGWESHPCYTGNE